MECTGPASWPLGRPPLPSSTSSQGGSCQRLRMARPPRGGNGETWPRLFSTPSSPAPGLPLSSIRNRSQPIIASSIRCRIVLELPCLRVKLHLQAPEMQDDLIVTFTSSCHALVSFSIGYFIYDAFDMVLYHRKRSTYELLVHHFMVITCLGIAVSTR